MEKVTLDPITVTAVPGSALFSEDNLFPTKTLPSVTDKERYSDNIEDAHDDSLTVILNDVIEKYSLKALDIRNMYKGQIILVYLLDRNIGDYVSRPKGTQICTREYLDEYHLAIYTHDHELTGTLYLVSTAITFEDWTWEINVTQWEPDAYWSPIENSCCHCCGHNSSDYLKPFLEDNSIVPGNTKVGWRGPALLMATAYKMPHMFTHYGTCADDYFIHRNRDLSSFETINWLTNWKRRFRIRDNGERPFTVEVYTGTKQVKIYKTPSCHDEDSSEEAIDGLKPEVALPFFDQVVKSFMVGESPKIPKTEFSGGYGERFRGNSLLLHIKDLEYIFVGSSIYSFDALSEIVNYVSPVGNSDVPYPYAIDSENRAYLLIENVIVQLVQKEVCRIPKFDPYNDCYYKKHLITTDMGCIPPHEPVVKNFHDIHGFYIGDERYTMTYKTRPEDDYDRLMGWDEGLMYNELTNGTKKELSKEEYVDIMREFGELMKFQPLKIKEVIHKRRW